MLKHRFQKGSAILIALFIMASLGVITLSASRIYMGEAKTTSSLTDSTSAYFGAQAALEEQLYNYQKDGDFQLSSECDSRIDATGCPALSTHGMKDLRTLPNTAVSRGQTYYFATVDSIDCKSATPCPLEKDQTGQIIIPAHNDITPHNDITLKWQWDAGSDRLLRISYIQGGVYQHEINSTVVPASETSHILANNSDEEAIYRFRPVDKTMGSNIKYWFESSDPGATIDNMKTEIIAQGEYNNTKRQLKAVLERNSGELNSIFDYTILSQDSID